MNLPAELFREMATRGDTDIAVGALKIVGRIAEKTADGPTACATPEMLEFMVDALQEAPFAVKIGVNEILLKLIGRWSTRLQYKVAKRYPFIPLLFAILDGIESSCGGRGFCKHWRVF
jgi:hypothetical protein